MKKSALTVAAAVAMTSGLAITGGSAQAAPVYNQDNTRVDLHGRLRMGLVNTDGDSSYENLSSRFGFRLNHEVDQNMSVFANTEFRFNSDEVNRDPMQIRNTFLGVDFKGIGRVYGGNFDSIYYQQITSLTDNMENNSVFRALNTGGQRGRGDTIAFDSADFNGVRFGMSAKLQPEDEGAGQEEAWSMMAYLGYSVGELNLAVGYDQANEDFTDGAEDALIGVRADYNFLPNFNVGAYAEQQGDLNHYAAGAKYRYGMGDLYATLSHLDNDGETDNIYTLGVNYKFSRPMYVFAEYASGSTDKTGFGFADEEKPVITLGARYNF
ncbi:MAG: porin [Aquisalimonadaceae bacterium]